MAIYENSFRGRANRKESAEHLNVEFDRLEDAFDDLDSLVNNSFTKNYVHTVVGGGTETIDPENGRLQEMTLTVNTTLSISDPITDGTGNTSISLLIHGSDIRIVNGWGEQTWKEYGLNSGLYLFTGPGTYASALLEFSWDGLAWVCVACTRNDDIGLTATQAHFLMLNSLTDTAAAETLGHTRTGPATGWDTNEAWHVFPEDQERYAGARIAQNWISEPSNLQGNGWTAVNASVATEVAAGPVSENVDKITFSAIDGEVNHWFLPDFGRYATSANPMRFVVTFKAKMFGAVTSGTVRTVVSLMGSDTETVLTPWDRAPIPVTDSWQTLGAIFTIDGDDDAYNLAKTFSSRTLTKLAFKAPAGSLGNPVMITDVQFEILKESDVQLPSEFQECTLGSSITLTETAASTGSWTDGTKALVLLAGEFVDFQDDLEPGNMYLCVPVLSSGGASDILMEADRTYWLGTYTGDTRYVASAPFAFQYNGGVFKFSAVVAGTYAVNIYKISAHTNTYDDENGNSIASGVVTYASGPPVTNKIFSGYIHETDARENLITSSTYRDFDNWTAVSLGSGGAIRSEWGMDGYPSHASFIEAANGSVNGYIELNVTIPDDSNTYAWSMFIRLLTDLAGDAVYVPQYPDLTTDPSRYYDASIKLTGGTTEVGGDVVRFWNYRDPDGGDWISEPSNHEYVTLGGISYNKSVGESYWAQPTMSLLNNGTGNTNCRIRIWPAPGDTENYRDIDVGQKGHILIDWCQLEEVVTAGFASSSPLPGGYSRGADTLTTALADGDLYDANGTNVGDITSGAWTFDQMEIYKNISWSTEVPQSTDAKNVHEFGLATVTEGASGHAGAVTQRDYYTSDPNFTHPFSGEVYDEITVGVVVQANTIPSMIQDRVVADFFPVNSDVLRIRRRSGSGQIFFSWSLQNLSGTAVASDAIELSIDHGTWNYNDWFWIGYSYSKALNVAKCIIVNLSQEEESVETAIVNNNIDVTWSATTTGSVSLCGWGGANSMTGSNQNEKWLGSISQLYMHNVYTDLDVEANRRKFVNLDGVKEVNLVTGDNILGVTPLVYLPSGMPSGNVGSKNIGSWPTSFYFAGSEVIGDSPPLSASP